MNHNTYSSYDYAKDVAIIFLSLDDERKDGPIDKMRVTLSTHYHVTTTAILYKIDKRHLISISD